MKLSKLTKLLFSTSIPALALSSCVTIASCGGNNAETATYEVTYDTDSYITWTSKPTTAAKGEDFSATYTTTNTTTINTSRCAITVDGTDITKQTGVKYSSGTIYIPSTLVTGAIKITLRTTEVAKYSVVLNAGEHGYYSTSSSTKTITLTTKTLKYTDCVKPTSNNDDEYSFDGWYTDSGCTVAATFPMDLSTGTVKTLYAGWKNVSTYTTFDPTNENFLKLTNAGYEIADNVITIKPSSLNADVTVELAGGNSQYQLKFQCKGVNLNIVFKGYKGSLSTLAPILFDKKPTSVTITSNDGTTNIINDTRSATADDSEAAITCKPDTCLNITGSGLLKINTTVAEGIRVKGNGILNITNAYLSVNSYDTAIRGNTEVNISSSTVSAYTQIGDGIKTKDIESHTSASSAEVRDGDITINDNSSVVISSGTDGISASHDFTVNDSSATVDIKTGKRSESTATITSDEKDFYLRTSSSVYEHSEDYYFVVYFDTDTGSEPSSDAESDQATLKKIITDKGSYSYFKANRPADSSYKYAYVYMYALSDSSKTPVAKSTCLNISGLVSSTSYDGMELTEVDASSGSITANTKSWFNYKSAIGSDNKSTRETTDYSSKGIKANGNINIAGGTVSINSSDDAIHAAYGTAYVPTTTGLSASVGQGNLNVTGGNVYVEYTGDDALHSDNTLTISDGYVNVSNSYEAVEAGKINISGGVTDVWAEDDAINAANVGKITGSNIGVSITGGKVFATAFGSDVDGIDSNNTISISNAIVVAMGSASGQSSGPGGGGGGDNSTAIDVDNGITLTNGLLVTIGKIDGSLSTSLKQNTIASSITTGTHTLSNMSIADVTFETEFSYSGNVYAWSSYGTPKLS